MATRFKDFVREIEEEARAEGPDAVAELEALRTHFRLGRQLAAARRVQRLSQKEVAARAGIDQADVSDLEREAREVFPATQIARDGAEYEIAFADAATEPPADANQLPVRASG